MTKEDLETAFQAILTSDPVYNGKLPEKFTSKEFIEDILGLQPVVPNANGGGAAPAAGPAANTGHKKLWAMIEGGDEDDDSFRAASASARSSRIGSASNTSASARVKESGFTQ